MHKADSKENSKEAIYNIKTHLNKISNLSNAVSSFSIIKRTIDAKKIIKATKSVK